jgi:hypothetical protein
MTKLQKRVKAIQTLFEGLSATSSKTLKSQLVEAFKLRYPALIKDLDFCFEVLAGKHKTGYILSCWYEDFSAPIEWQEVTIRSFYQKVLTGGTTDDDIVHYSTMAQVYGVRDFMFNLVNRLYRLGFSNKNEMVTDLTPMLAEKYHECPLDQVYIIQEKLNGQRCLASYNSEASQWEFTSRNGKPKEYPFDTTTWNKSIIYDGEVLNPVNAGNKHFAESSGLANRRGLTGKEKLHYFVYDIIDIEKPFKERYRILSENRDLGPNASIIQNLATLYVSHDLDDNKVLDVIFDEIVAKGGEGIMLRDPDAVYQHKRTRALIKRKPAYDCSLRIYGYKPGMGKNAGGIGSFLCRSDCGSIKTRVGGLTDGIIWGNFKDFDGQIIDVEYFGKSWKEGSLALMHPRFKGFRDDLDETSL